MFKCSFIYVTTRNNNISCNLGKFLQTITEKNIHAGLCAATFFNSFKTKLQKFIFRHYWQMMSDILKTSYTEAIFEAAPHPLVYLFFSAQFQKSNMTCGRREQMLLSKELKKGILSHKLKILPIPESKLKRRCLLLKCWNKNLHKPLVTLEQAHGRYSPSSTEVGDRACVVQSVVRSSPQPLLYKRFQVPRSNCLV